MSENPFEIPYSLREVSEQNLKQAHATYDQFMDFVTKAMDAWMGAMPSNPMIADFKKVNGRTMQFAKDNADCAFAFSSQISNAQTVFEILALQTQFAQDRMQEFTVQSQELCSLIEEALQKVERSGIDNRAFSPMSASFNAAGFQEATGPDPTLRPKATKKPRFVGDDRRLV